MVGKITTVLTKKEAEAYRTQGLHQEALRLYQNLLASSPNLGTTFRDAIQSQVDAIQSELVNGPPTESKMLSAPEIRRIKEGWGAKATESDLLVCAQAFFQVEHYHEALTEAAKLVQKGCSLEKVMALIAGCLMQLQTPKQLRRCIGSVGKKIVRNPQERSEFYLLLTEEMIAQKHKDHAVALYVFLQQDLTISTKAPQRLESIAKAISNLEDHDSHFAGERKSILAESSQDDHAQCSINDRKKKRFGWFSLFKKRNLRTKKK